MVKFMKKSPPKDRRRQGTKFIKMVPHVMLGHGVLILLLICGIGLTFTFQGPLGSLLAAATSSLTRSPAVMYFTPYGSSSLPTGDTTDIDININAKVPINAIGATIKYPAEVLEIVGVNKEKSFFDLWTEDTVIKEDSGEVHFSGGTTMLGGLTGTGTVLTLSVRAKKDSRGGDAKITVENLQVLASDGQGTTLDSSARSFSYTILQKTPETAPEASGAAPAPRPDIPRAPNADFDGNGSVTIVDMSILTVHMVMAYDPRYDLDTNGTIGLSDLSILFSRM